MIWGQNGSGKTSILEAVHLLSIGKSFKTHKPRSIIRYGDKRFVVKGTFSFLNKKETIAVQNTTNNKQTIKLNGLRINNRKEIIGRNNVVVLSPEDQGITKNQPKNCTDS